MTATLDPAIWAGHVPGPWAAMTQAQAQEAGLAFPVAQLNLHDVYSVSGFFPRVDDTADAALIAAAPALAARVAELEAENARLRGIIASVHATMQALHPSAAGDMTNMEYARLWNATLEMLDREDAARAALAASAGEAGR